jgi:signal transduction histidine kinase
MNILVADADSSVREMLWQFLQKKGHHLIEVTDGRDALHKIVRRNAQIALLDWELPGMSGVEVCRRLREKEGQPYVFVVLLTSGIDQADLLESFEAGVDEYLEKPINLLELNARLKVGQRIINLERTLVKKQEELEESNQIKNKFIGIVAHDLRNPVISIRGFSELLLKSSAQLSDEQKEFISIIHSTSRNMLAMINDLLDISRIESGQMEIVYKPGSLRELVLERIRLYEVQAGQKHIRIHPNLNEIESIAFDPHRISQAIDNLISNAVKFSPTGTNIYVDLYQSDSRAVFSVHDEGPGIPYEEQALLFSEFHRLSIRPTAGETSTGLGLAITKRIMEAHGGSIEFESREGQGSVFSLLLPADNVPARE